MCQDLLWNKCCYICSLHSTAVCHLFSSTFQLVLRIWCIWFLAAYEWWSVSVAQYVVKEINRAIVWSQVQHSYLVSYSIAAAFRKISHFIIYLYYYAMASLAVWSKPIEFLSHHTLTAKTLQNYIQSGSIDVTDSGLCLLSN